MADRDGIAKDGAAKEGRGAWRRVRRSIASDLPHTTIYRHLALKARPPESLAGRLRDLRPGDPVRGRLLLEGVFIHGGERLAAGREGDVWALTAPSDRFRAWLHSFAWLRDLLAADSERGPAQARALVDGWIRQQSKGGDKAARAAGPAARRTYFWLADAPVLFPDQDPRSLARLDALARHARLLEQLIGQQLDLEDSLPAAVALAAAGACLPDDRLLELGLGRCAEEAQRQVLPDGGHVSRSPEAGVELLADLCALDDAVYARGRETPEALRRAVDRLAPMLRFFLAPDGGLAAFHGGGEGDRGLIEALLAADEGGAKPFELAPYSGYHRAASGGSRLILDVAAPAPPALASGAHASCLAFELATTGGRLIVNCGWHGDQGSRFREPVRATAAHSTLTLADTSSARLPKQGRKRESSRGTPAAQPARRNDEERGVWIEGAHEGYRQAFGLVHNRRIFFSDQGDNLRGEDALVRPLDDAQRSEPAATAYALRFHLGVGVSAEVDRDRRSATLVQPSGEAWRFRTDSGPIEVEPSIYLAAGGGPQETCQLVLRGAARLDGAPDRPPNRVRWALQRLGRPSAE